MHCTTIINCSAIAFTAEVELEMLDIKTCDIYGEAAPPDRYRSISVMTTGRATGVDREAGA